MKTIEYDILGQICPSTLLLALKEINTHQLDLRAGRVVLRFRTDNRDCLVTIPDSAKNMGYEIRIERNDGYYDILISGGGDGRSR